MTSGDYSYSRNDYEEDGNHRPYAIPWAFLPASCDLPTSKNASDSVIIDDDLRDKLGLAADTVGRVRARLTYAVVAPLEVAFSLESLRRSISKVYKILESEHADLDRSIDGQSSDLAIEQANSQATPEQLRGYSIYDGYFQVRRVPMMCNRQWIAQTLATIQALLLDLPFAMVSLEQLEVIFEAIEVMMRILHVGDLVQSSLSQNQLDVVVSDETHIPLWQGYWKSQSLVVRGEAERIASYRWKVGHQFFNIAAIFGRAHLIKSTDLIEQEEWEQAPPFLDQASLFWRATTAAMWYAGAFPALIYQSHTRPTMQSTETPDGFSGDQNIDYKRLKQAKDSFKRALHQHSLKEDGNEHRFTQALLRFREAYLQDMESHILLAAAKVGMDLSLTQHVYASGAKPGTRPKTATDLLRDLALARQCEFDF